MKEDDQTINTEEHQAQPTQVNRPLSTTCVEQTAVGSSYSEKHLLDLRLMHHYCISTADYFAADFHPDVASALKVSLPRLAYEHEVLMDAILHVAMIHLVCTEPERPQTLSIYVYRDKALRSLCDAIGSLTESNIDAVRSASDLLSTVSFATDRVSQQSDLWVMNWLTLAHGRRNLHASSIRPTIIAGQRKEDPAVGLYGSFKDLPIAGSIPSGILRAMEKDEGMVNKTYSTTLSKAAGEIGILYTMLDSQREHTWLAKHIKAWAFDIIEARFLDMLRQKTPCALVILAHYLALFSLLPQTWLYEGLMRHDITIIAESLGERWKHCIIIPRLISETENQETLNELMERFGNGHSNEI